MTQEGWENEKMARSVPGFLVRVVVIHTLTYIIAGLLASSLLNYRHAFTQPVVRDYMVAFGSASSFWGPVAQLLRGLVIGLALLPLRSFLAGTKHGWLVLWWLFIAIGIVATPAAAPGSLEGVVYTRLPGWYHALGLPEMLLQTLAFSVLMHLYLSRPAGVSEPSPSSLRATVTSLAGACFAFIGYAAVSVFFALFSQADVTAEANLSLKTQGLFIAPFVLNFAALLALSLNTSASRVGRTAIFFLIFLSNAAALLLYQAFVLDGVNVVYALVAPVLPAAIVAAMSGKDGLQVLKQPERSG